MRKDGSLVLSFRGARFGCFCNRITHIRKEGKKGMKWKLGIIGLLCGACCLAADFKDYRLTLVTTNNGQYVYDVPTNQVIVVDRVQLHFTNEATGGATVTLKGTNFSDSLIAATMATSTNASTIDCKGAILYGNRSDQIVVDATACSQNPIVVIYGTRKIVWSILDD